MTTATNETTTEQEVTSVVLTAANRPRLLAALRELGRLDAVSDTATTEQALSTALEVSPWTWRTFGSPTRTREVFLAAAARLRAQ